jgi:hypothetical protein
MKPSLEDTPPSIAPSGLSGSAPVFARSTLLGNARVSVRHRRTKNLCRREDARSPASRRGHPGGVAAHQLSAGFVPICKKGKLLETVRVAQARLWLDEMDAPDGGG